MFVLEQIKLFLALKIGAGAFSFAPRLRVSEGTAVFDIGDRTAELPMWSTPVMNEQANDLWTVSRIAEHLSIGRHRVEYVIKTRRIKPIAIAGPARVFSNAEVERIRLVLEHMTTRRDGGPHAE